MKNFDIKVNFKGGGSLVDLPPIFSPDGEQVFTSWKNFILAFNTKTGKLLHTYKGITNNIVGFSVHNHNSYNCLTACSVTGEVVVWKTTTRFKIFEKQIPTSFAKNIRTFHIVPSKLDDDLIALISFKKKTSILFALYDINKKTHKLYSLKLEKGSFFLDVSISKPYFTVAKDNVLYFIKIYNFEKIHKVKIKNREFTCIACHPEDEIVLAGDNTGRVVAWHGIFENNRAQTVYHWHTLPVNCVSFSSTGSYFYSGGDECVLVKWQLNNTLEKSFVPRLAAEIRHITVAEDNLFVALATSDNAVRIFDSRLYQINLIQHLVLGKQFESGIIYDPRTKALIMNGNVGHVQFYAPNTMNLLYNLDIVGRNKITRERNCPMQNTDVTKLAISRSGHWLASVEERKDYEYQYEIRLKFWKFDTTKQLFELNTSVEYPHESSISNILFQPILIEKSLKCVTVAKDKQFKIWQVADVEIINEKKQAWKCLSNVSYRDLPCDGLSFSMDGSLIAVGFDTIVTVWSPETCELKCSLIHPNHRQKISHVQFGNSNECHLLVAASSNQLSVWNILTLALTWTVPVNVSLLISDTLSTNMAVLGTDKKLFIFSPGSKDLIYGSADLIEDDVVAAAFVPGKHCNNSRLNWFERSQFYFVNSRNELYCISGGEYEDEIDYGFSDEIEISTPFNRTIANSRTTNRNVLTPSRHLYKKDIGHKNIKSYLEAPLQTMVPISNACSTLLKSLVVQKETVS